jgi:hypothetical protein
MQDAYLARPVLGIGKTHPLRRVAVKFDRMTPLVLSLVFAGLLLATPGHATTWTYDIVPLPEIWGVYTSLELDGSDNPRVSCSRADIWQTTAVMYTEKNAGVWSTDTIFTAFPDAGYRSSLVLDASGNPHISFTVVDFGTFEKTLYYATRSGGVWSNQVVDGSLDADRWNSLALDSAGNPHIAYVDGSTGSLQYASLSGGMWSYETADAGPGVEAFTSLVIDASDIPHISYSAGGGLKYAIKVVGIWAQQVVDDTTSAEFPSLAVDASGTAHIAYNSRRTASSFLKYAVRTGGSWTLETVDQPGDLPFEPSIALDAGEVPHISYYDGDGQDLLLASRDGGFWSIEAVDTAGRVGEWSSIAFNSDDNAVISYHDHNVEELKLATESDPVSAGLPLIASGMQLRSPIPNPRRGYESVTLDFILPETRDLTFEVLNVTGRLIAERPVTRYTAGSHRVSWAIDALPPGVYFVRMQTDLGQVADTKLVVLP